MEKREECVLGSKSRSLDCLRLLDLDDQLGRREQVVGIGCDLGTGSDILIVEESGPVARAGLDGHIVTVAHDLGHAVRGEPDSVLVAFDLSRHANVHVAPPNAVAHRRYDQETSMIRLNPAPSDRLTEYSCVYGGSCHRIIACRSWTRSIS